MVMEASHYQKGKSQVISHVARSLSLKECAINYSGLVSQNASNIYDGLVCEKGGSFGTAPISPIFSLLQGLKNDKSKMATPRGFEPLFSP